MDPDVAWGSAKTRAWIVGVVLGMVGGLLSAGVGLFAGLCCLFQFANILGPALTGLLAGLAAAGMAPWEELGGGNPGSGAGLAARAAIPAAVGAAVLGFFATMIWPIASAGIQAVSTGADIGEALMVAVMALTASGITAFVFTGAGAVLGTVLGLAAGAVVGAIR